jgi:hypothetical protein
MAGFGGVQEHRRRAGASQCSGNLASDMTGFAHPGNYYFASISQDQFDRVQEAIAQAFGRRQYSLGFDLHGATGGGQPVCLMGHPNHHMGQIKGHAHTTGAPAKHSD